MSDVDLAFRTVAELSEQLRVGEVSATEVVGAFLGRIIGAEGYSHVGHLVDDPALPLDDDIRPRIWLGREMSAVDYLRRYESSNASKRNVWTRSPACMRCSPPPPPRRLRSSRRSTRPPPRPDSRVRSICWRFARWHCRTAGPSPACRPPCGSSAGSGKRRSRCESAALTRRRPIDIFGARRWIDARRVTGVMRHPELRQPIWSPRA